MGLLNCLLLSLTRRALMLKPWVMKRTTRNAYRARLQPDPSVSPGRAPLLANPSPHRSFYALTAAATLLHDLSLPSPSRSRWAFRTLVSAVSRCGAQELRALPCSMPAGGCVDVARALAPSRGQAG